MRNDIRIGFSGIESVPDKVRENVSVVAGGGILNGASQVVVHVAELSVDIIKKQLQITAKQNNNISNKNRNRAILNLWFFLPCKSTI